MFRDKLLKLRNECRVHFKNCWTFWSRDWPWWAAREI